MDKGFSFIRQGIGICIGIVGLWVLGLTTDFPKIHYNLGNLLTHPSFLEWAVPLPSQDKPVVSLLVNRWSFLTDAELPEVEEIPFIPPKPVPIEVEPQEEALPSQEQSGDWVTVTMGGKEGYLEKDGIYVVNSGKVPLYEESLTAFSPSTLYPDGESPQILIFHSHGTEAYTQTAGAFYEESDPFRTLDMDHNITVVGAAMAEVFESAGFSVIHDKTLHDYPDYNASYGNSYASLLSYLEAYPSLSLIIDVHRDALCDSDGTPYQIYSEDQDSAQVMMVIGTNGDGYDHPNWTSNFSLALTLQQGLLDYGDLVRPITLRSSRFNQHLSPGAILLEVGGHGNTLEQAVNGGILFAESAVATLSGVS